MRRFTPTYRRLSKWAHGTRRALYHPIPAFISLIRHYFYVYGLCLLEVFRLYGLCKLHHTLNCVRFEQVLIIEMVEKNVEPFLSVDHMGLEIGWRLGLYALHIRAEKLKNWSGLG
jgi:hypothetical protein